jgi:thiamine-phosphate pyrophosphorylase
MVVAALEGGVAVLQYRNKKADAALQKEQAGALVRIARAKRVPLIINDNVALAAELDADGAHVGRDDGQVAVARRLIPGKLLGASCYASLESACSAVAEGADHVAFGSVFDSPTKPGAARAPLTLFARARSLGVPLVAIGGITTLNAPDAIAAGADCVAVITDLFGAADIPGRARTYRELFESRNA